MDARLQKRKSQVTYMARDDQEGRLLSGPGSAVMGDREQHIPQGGHKKRVHKDVA